MFGLLRHFSLTSAALVLVVTIALGAYHHWHAARGLIDWTEKQNLMLAQSFANAVWPRFSSYVASVPAPGGDGLRARPEAEEFRKAVEELTAGLPILKVKVYDLEGLTVYSSQSSEIGENKSSNLGFLKSARQGTPASKLSFRDAMSAISGIVTNRDMVESYLPIRGGDGEVEGVFELYTDVTPLVAQINRRTAEFALGLLLALGLMYGALHLIVRRADRILKKQYSELRVDEEKIRAKNTALEHEIAQREQAEEALRGAHDMLELRVRDRTADLEEQIAERKRADKALRRSEARAKAAEQLLSDAIESISDGFVLYDSEDRLVLCNRKWLDLYGYSESRVRPGILYEDLVRLDVDLGAIADEGAGGEDYIRQRIEYRRRFEGSFDVHLADGRWITIRERRTLDGGIVGVQTDITERKQVEDSMLAAKQEAELANRAKSEFLANISYELRTPLNAIIGFAEIIKNEILGAIGISGYREYAEDIHDSGQHLLKLINDILDMSKVQAGKDELREGTLDVTETIRSCVTLMSGRAHGAGLAIELDVPDILPPLYADGRKLKQILINLLSNAVKFSPGGGAITVRSRVDRNEGCFIEVSDPGIGIAPEDIPTALASFGQIANQTNRKYEGTGLGLPLCKAFIEMHDGSLELRSELGAGTRVTIRFPARRIVSLPEEDAASGETAETASRKFGS
jgi:PAS domain S-box-containing protein